MNIPPTPRVASTHTFRAVNGVDIVRRIRRADGVEDVPVYYGVHELERAHVEAEAVRLDAIWYRGRVWRRVVVEGGELVWRADECGPTSSGVPVPMQRAPGVLAEQPSLLGAWS